jgi:hypothetical protein
MPTASFPNRRRAPPPDIRLIGAVLPIMLKTAANPGGVPMETGCRAPPSGPMGRGEVRT